ncbi:quinone oxidoreductase family protein [Parvularcula marina]|uniref:Zinc-binding dehydrogenase n=1 Tax=Parvularcula marina TaxID=2292771 RepID=A0A371RLE9_9PROT|nr:zinc-binding dehydrogenase [Parvularcula marina]RFB06251.1 zinc-binding dehydrogenase [Parvularcula marina]
MTGTMRAAVLHAAGPPEAFSLEDIAIPEVKPGEVRVRVKACGVSFRDVVERNGTYRRDVTFPLVIGLEIAGVVEETGQGVSLVKEGDHVCTKAFSSCGMCRYCRSGRETTCLNRQPVRGGYAEYVVLPQDAFVRIPLSLAFEKACMLGAGAGVALNAVRDTARTKIGDRVLVTGATGGVGLPAVQIAHHAGAEVIAVTRSESKRAMLEQAGAHHVIVADGDFSTAVRDVTGGEGADVIIDTVGSHVFDAAYNSLALHGRYAFVGQLNSDKISINPARIFFKRAQLLGVGSVSRAQLADVIELAEQDIVRPQIAEVMPLEDIVKAHHLVEASASVGRIVVTP